MEIPGGPRMSRAPHTKPGSDQRIDTSKARPQRGFLCLVTTSGVLEWQFLVGFPSLQSTLPWHLTGKRSLKTSFCGTLWWVPRRKTHIPSFRLVTPIASASVRIRGSNRRRCAGRCRKTPLGTNTRRCSSCHEELCAEEKHLNTHTHIHKIQAATVLVP